ncbi:hypothetical protein [Deinococcus hopiensis]|uniref:hypothetical protein n=1 Tax=Deinococcus hopiensis TaxID=309885 RepID=UPI000A04BBDE|nr:hypothetical protein [Deinococcus hopiensis]
MSGNLAVYRQVGHAGTSKKKPASARVAGAGGGKRSALTERLEVVFHHTVPKRYDTHGQKVLTVKVTTHGEPGFG